MASSKQMIWVDFGISGLTKWFHGPWSEEAAPLEIVEGAADWGGGSYAPTLLEDAVRLLESPLTSGAIDILWCAATRRRYEAGMFGIAGQDWLRQIVDVCVARIRQDEPSFTPVSPRPPSGALRDEVLAEVRAVAPELATVTGMRTHYPVPDVVPTLEQVVTNVDPDLGFRLFLRVMKAYRVPISEERYDRYHELGECFGYNEFVVDDGDLCVRPSEAG